MVRTPYPRAPVAETYVCSDLDYEMAELQALQLRKGKGNAEQMRDPYAMATAKTRMQKYEHTMDEAARRKDIVQSTIKLFIEKTTDEDPDLDLDVFSSIMLKWEDIPDHLFRTPLTLHSCEVNIDCFHKEVTNWNPKLI